MPVIKKIAAPVVVLNQNDDGSWFAAGPGNDLVPFVMATKNPTTGVVSGFTAGGQDVALGGASLPAIKGEEVLDFALAGFLPAGASFSGTGSYNSEGRIATQNTGTVRHNPTGWKDGTACLEFTPNANSLCELRMFFDGAAGTARAPMNWSDTNGVAFDFEITGFNTALTLPAITCTFANNAANIAPPNRAAFAVFRNDNATQATQREIQGRYYVRQRFDHLATDAAAGYWVGYGYNAAEAGTGADWRLPVNVVRLTFSQFSGQTIKFKRIRRGGWSMPCVVMGTDNATPETLASHVAPMMARNNIAHYANQYTATLANPQALARFQRLYESGWELNPNDVVDRPLGQVLDQATVRSAIEQSRDFYRAQGWTRGNKVWIANNNSDSAMMRAELLAAGFVADRLGGNGDRYAFPEGGIPDPMKIPSVSIDNRTLTTIQPYVDRAITMGCTIWLYYHNVWPKADLDTARTLNLTGTAGAPIAVNAGETPGSYRARMVALATPEGNASVTYLDARIGSIATLAIWSEDLEEVANYIGGRIAAGGMVSMTPTQWCKAVGIL
jgi:hypothetical protein